MKRDSNNKKLYKSKKKTIIFKSKLVFIIYECETWAKGRHKKL